MKLKLKLVRDGKEEFLWTNLWSIAEWERLENRRVASRIIVVGLILCSP